jgi:uncharacterized membrane protein
MDSPQQQQFSDLTKAVNEVLKRQSSIEERLERLERIVKPPAQPKSTPPVLTVVEEPVPIVIAPAMEASQPLPVERGLESKVGLTVINRVGVLTLVLGVAFFFKWAVDNDWIGPGLRVILGMLAGCAALALADFLWHKAQQIFAQGITAAGIAILYLSIYAAFNYYHLVPQWLAMALMIGITALAGALSLRYNSLAIAAMAMIGGYLTPLLLSTGEDHPWFLFSYVLLLNIASAELAIKRKWAALEAISFAATVLIYTAWRYESHPGENLFIATLAPLAFCAQRWRTTLPRLYPPAQILTAIAIGFVWASGGALLFFSLALLIAAGGLAFAVLRSNPNALIGAFAGLWFSYGIWSTNTHATLSAFAGLTAAFLLFYTFSFWRASSPAIEGMIVQALNGAAYFAASYAILHSDYHGDLGLLAVALAALYFAFAAYLHNAADQTPVLLALGMSLCFLTLAIPIQFTGFTITIAWALIAAAVNWIGARLNSQPSIIAAAGVFALTFIRLVLYDASMLPDPRSYLLIANLRFLTFAVSAASLFFAARCAVRYFRKLALAEYLCGHFVLLWALTMEVIGWAEPATSPENRLSVETVSISVLFGVYAVALVSAGVATRTIVNRLSGLVLIGFVILKLYFFDVWQLGRLYQISAFVALGVLLLSMSFLYSRFRRVVEGWWKNDKAGT